MNVLVLNCGSSSIKFKLIAMPSETTVMEGNEPRREGRPLRDAVSSIFRRAGRDVGAAPTAWCMEPTCSAPPSS